MYKKNEDRKIFFYINLVISGKGGHSSVPYLTKNPIPAAFRLIQIINGKLLYEFNSFQNIALYPLAFNSGSQQNIIPDEASLRFRGECTNQEDKKQLLDIFENSVKAIEGLYSLKTRIDYEK